MEMRMEIRKFIVDYILSSRSPQNIGDSKRKAETKEEAHRAGELSFLPFLFL